MVNWCIEESPLQGTPLAADDPKMTAILSYTHQERRGVPLAAGNALTPRNNGRRGTIPPVARLPRPFFPRVRFVAPKMRFSRWFKN